MPVKSNYMGGLELTGKDAEWFKNYIRKKPSNQKARDAIRRALNDAEEYERRGWKFPRKADSGARKLAPE